MKNKNVVLMLEPRGVISSEGVDTMYRQDLYLKSLIKVTWGNPFNLVIFSGSKNNETSHRNGRFFFIKFISRPTFNPVLFAYKSLRQIRSNDLEVRLLVVGDPWESYWSAYLLNKFLRNKIPIQIQVHGDIAHPLWRHINLKNRFRFHIARNPLRNCDSIRCVSKNQKFNLISAYGLESERITVIPVPIKISNKSLSNYKRPRTIAFIGRIHEDRGTDNFIQLVESLNAVDKKFKVLIAGSGPGKDKFLAQLMSLFPKNRIMYLGYLSQLELQNTWKSVGVLVSTAPVESYGRVLRESLIAGVPVWATESSGVLDLLNVADPGTVKLLDLNKDTVKLIEEFELLLDIKVGSKFRNKFVKDNNSYALKLASSWVETIENSKR